MRKKQEALEEEISEKTPIDKLVALTFDDHPEIRMKAAQVLEKIDDPRAFFALVELSSDKDAAVRNFAEEALGKKTTNERYTSLEKLFAPRPERTKATPASSSAEEEEREEETAEWGLAPIEEFFEGLEEKKVRSARERLLPSIEKLFGKAEDERSKRIKQMLMSSIEKYFRRREVRKKAKKKEREEAEIGGEKEESAISQIEEIKAEVSLPELEEERIEDVPEFLRESEIYKRAYALASTPGITKKIMKQEEKRLIENYKKDVQLAFKLAILRAAEKGRRVEGVGMLEEGMKDVCTGELEVGALEEKEVKCGRKREKLMRLLLKDAGGEIALYIPPERGRGISIGDRIKLEGAKVRSISGEKALFLLPKGKILVAK